MDDCPEPEVETETCVYFTKPEEGKFPRSFPRNYGCLMKLLDCGTLPLPSPSSSSKSVSETEMEHTCSAQPPYSENLMRNPPKWISVESVWRQKDYGTPNKYQKFIREAASPQYHPPWRTTKPPSGWALSQMQFDDLIVDLANWMKEELETPGHVSSVKIDVNSLRHMFDFDLSGHVAKKIKVIPKELRCVFLPEELRRSEKQVPLPPELNMLRKVKELAIGDIQASSEHQDFAFWTQLPADHPMRHRPKQTPELFRWTLGREAHPELYNWGNVLKGMDNLEIGCAFAQYVQTKLPNISPDLWPANAAQVVCERDNRNNVPFPRAHGRSGLPAHSKHRQKVHAAPAFSKISLKEKLSGRDYSHGDGKRK